MSVSEIMFGWLRWYLAKSRLAATPWTYPTGRVSVFSLPHTKEVQISLPCIQPYAKLAVFWEAYAKSFSPDYGRFLASAQRHYQLKIGSVLDLACGTGLLTRRISNFFESVVGLDISDAMLNEATCRSESDGVRFVLGDFRDFYLERTFDAVICAGDSMNYVQNTDEIGSIFRCVYRHLSSGGIFVFDALNARACRNLLYTKTVVTVNEESFVIYFLYNPETKVSEDLVVFNNCVEKHRRIPIEESQIQDAASNEGFEVCDIFATSIFSSLGYRRHFYLLRKP